MKKTLASMLILVVAMSMAVSVMAVSVEDNSYDVKASYEADQTKTVYSVDISWGSMAFTYSEGSKGDWDTENHEYKEDTEVAAGWKCAENANVVTVTNHSNTEVTATAEFEKKDGLAAELAAVAVQVSDGGTKQIASAEGGEEQTGTFTVTVSGNVTGEFAENTVLGTITITIN